MSAIVEGWPARSGPLQTLHKIGLVDDPKYRPKWLHYPTTDPRGIPTYYGTSDFLSEIALRSLAALTFEGWDVFIAPGTQGQGLRIRVRGKSA